MTSFVALLSVGTGCSDSNPAPATPDTCASPPTNVSFKDQVQPILQGSCGISSSCHGSTTASAELLFLGSNNAPASDSNDKVYGHLVNVGSREVPSMVLVSPGDPGQSFLMHKMDGNFIGIRCGTDGCGTMMPQSESEPLDVCTREAIRVWISEGAKDN